MTDGPALDPANNPAANPATNPAVNPAASPRCRDGRGVGLALLAILIQTAGTAIAARGQAAQLDLLGYALLAGGGLAVGFRLRFPGPAIFAVAAAAIAYHALDYPRGPTLLAVVIVALSLVRADHFGPLFAAMALSSIAWTILAGLSFWQGVLLVVALAGLFMLSVAVIGIARMIRKMLQEQKRLHEERQRRQTSEERLRIAHELHDVLGHHLSLINVRAGIGLHLMDRQPGQATDQARAALDAIKESSAEALREVQSVLNALYPTGEHAPRQPAPGLDRLRELTADAGIPVRTTITGEPRPLPPEIDRAAFRIVQEALTNVRRHAGSSATAVITIDYPAAGNTEARAEDAVVIQIENDGTAYPTINAPTPGNGITSMRERAAALGGSLTAAPIPTGGWRVRAVLPLDAHPHPPNADPPNADAPNAHPPNAHPPKADAPNADARDADPAGAGAADRPTGGFGAADSSGAAA